MNIERLKELVDTVKVIEDLERQIINRNTKIERAEERYKAVVEIQKYISNIAEIAKDLCFEIDFPLINLYYINNNVDKSDSRTRSHHLVVRFDKGNVTFIENAFGSELRWNDFCNISKDKIYIYGRDDDIDSNFVRLVNKWSQIKSTLETGIEKALLEQIKDKKIKTNNFINSCQKIIEFTI